MSGGLEEGVVVEEGLCAILGLAQRPGGVRRVSVFERAALAWGNERAYPAAAILAGTSLGANVCATATGCGRSDRNHPAESQELGMENSDHPQSRQTRMSGDGVMGGWLIVRGLLR